MTITPTLHFRWSYQVDRNLIIRGASTCCGVLLAKYPEEDDEYFILQQWWKDDLGGGEWREIEIDYSYSNNPPQ
jgi:hypothetical protein